MQLRKGESIRPNGTYCYRYVGEDGKRKAIYAKTIQELRNKYQIKHKEVNNTTVRYYFQKSLSFKKYLKPQSVRQYKTMFNRIEKYFEDRDIRTIKKSDIKQFIVSMSQEITQSTTKSIFKVLRIIFNTAIDDQIIVVNPCNNIPKSIFKVAIQTQKKTALTKQEENQFMQFLKENNKKLYPLILFLLNTGLRINQAACLRWQDIDYQNNVIHITKSRCLRYNSIEKPKTKAGIRDIPITQQIKCALQLVDKKSQQYVFISKFKGLINSDKINQSLKRVVKKYNDTHCNKLPNITCHTFRHTYATRLTQSGINIKAIQYVLGHAAISTTMNIYTDANNDFVQQQLKKLNQ